MSQLSPRTTLSSPSSSSQKTVELGTATFCIYNCSIRILAQKIYVLHSHRSAMTNITSENWNSIIDYYNLKISLKLLVKKLLLVNTVPIIARNAVCRLVWKEKIITRHMVAITETTVSNFSSFHSFTLSKALCNSIIKYTTLLHTTQMQPILQHSYNF